ncbi:hypothetical protein K1W54_08605 [Micromonospora sp. CPCC 205371]|nr:hypothetical protein [Micromonospora sp. CPCC 205371]
MLGRASIAAWVWLTDKLCADIINRYEQGQTERQIAASIGRGRGRDAVRRVLDAAGVQRRPCGPAGAKAAST